MKLKMLPFLLLLASCSTVTPFPTEQKMSAKAPRPLPFRVALLPLKLGYTPTKKLENPEEYLAEINREKFLGSFVAILKKHPLFSSSRGKALEVYSKKDQQIYSQKENIGKEDYLRRAWDEKKDLLMELELKKYRLSYGGVSTGTYLANMFFWFYMWVPSWWVADEMYRAEVTLHIKITSVQSGALVFEDDVTVEREDYLNDWDRGWKLLGIFTIPSYLSKSNWKDIRESMAPWMENKLRHDFWTKLDGDFRRFTKTKEFGVKTRKTLALVVGIGRYTDEDIRATIYGEQDATAFKEILQGRIRQVKILTDRQATKKNIFDTIQTFLAERLNDNDRVILYFAGYGAAIRKATGSPEFYLIPNDANFADLPKTSISLSRLLSTISALPSKHRWVILDTSLGGSLTSQSQSGRSLTYAWNLKYGGGIPKNAWAESIAKLKSLSAKTTLLLSCAPDQDALELKESQRGLFNFYLTKKLKSLVREKGEVPFATLFRYIEKKVASQAKKRHGTPQKIQCFPNLPKKENWYLSDRPIGASAKKNTRS